MRIYKYHLDIRARQKITIPSPGRILSIGVQDETIVLWAEADPEQEQVVTHTIIGLLTGQEYDFNLIPKKFINTVILNEGAFVMHFFLEK